MALMDYSPHLAGVLRRTMGGIDPTVEAVFEVARLHGGFSEINFERDPHASYNPRPARVALILIFDANILDSLVVAAGILACANLTDIPEGLLKDLPDGVVSAAQSANICFNNPTFSNDSNSLSAVITTALWLDYARHLHLSAKFHQKAFLSAILEKHKVITSLASDKCASLSPILEAWGSRASKKLLTLPDRASLQ